MKLFSSVFLLAITTSQSFSQIYGDIPLTAKDSVTIREVGGSSSNGLVYINQHDILLFKIGFVTHAYSALELGVFKNFRIKEKELAGILVKWGPAAGVELVFKKDAIACAPKISYDMYLAIFSLRNNLLYYIDPNGRSSLKYRPEIGLTIIGYINVLYGFNVAFSNRDFIPARHNLSVSLGLSVFSKKYKSYKDMGDSPTYVLEYPYKSGKKIRHKLIDL